MKFLKEWFNERINENIECFDINEFNNLKNISESVHIKKASWKNRNITVVLKIWKNPKIIENDFKELIAKLKVLREVNHSNINRFLGLTRDSNNNYFSMMEYANEGNLRDYLNTKFSKLQWDDKMRMALDITRGLMCLHSENIIHGNLHACNVLVNNGSMMITDLRLLKQVEDITSEYTVYVDPQYLRNPSYERDMKSDIYSFGILLWELSSGRPPFFDYIQRAFGLIRIENKLLNGEREKPVTDTPLEYLQLYQKCWHDDPNLRPEINEAYKILSELKSQLNSNKQYQVTDGKNLSSNKFIDKEVSDRSSFPYAAKVTPEISKSSPQQITRQLKLNHGIVLNGYDIIPSIQEVVAEDGELTVNLIEGSPLVYTSINSDDKELKIDTCINFPVAEIVYNGNLMESFLGHTNGEKKLRELCGDFLARRFIVGGQLFIEDFNSATTTQADILKNYLFCVDNSVKYSTEIQISNLFTLNLLPKLVTLDGKKINTHEKLINWMNDLYQNKIVNVISYGDLIPISRLRDGTLLMDGNFEASGEKQPGVDNFEMMLDFDDWAGDAVDSNLMVWAQDFNLFRGLVVKGDEIETSEKIAIDIIKIPRINLRDESHLKMIRPSTTLENNLIANNIFSIQNLNPFPFVRNNVQAYEGYDHVLLKHEQYEISLNENNMVRPTQEFEQVIEEALNSMRPVKSLQDIFNEYGHLFSQRIILGGFLKDILPNFPSSDTFDDINNIDEIFNQLDQLNISSLITKKGRTVEKKDIHKWIQNRLEAVEFDNIIPLYKILKAEQQRKIDYLLQNNYKILLTGITNLSDLDNKNSENYKRINFDLSMESEDYEVFGLIISENNTKFEEIYVNFGLYDFNGFYAIIKKGRRNIDVTKYYILWIIIGNPLKLSIFSPKNRDFQVNYLKRSVTLRSNKSNYLIETTFPLHEGYTGFVHANHSSINYESNNIIKIIEWKKKSIEIQIETTYKFELETNSENSSDSDNDPIINLEIDLYICIISTNYENLKIDNVNGKEYPLNSIGYALNRENFSETGTERQQFDRVTNENAD
ncbi:kinase-like domain-containing protein [Rhizophagus clarus]|uniref:Kinase-like domain-containing protein n=1 Tax=Rhizophagus clarus TaxID=94130 RepID=A0A8H3KRA0_9GLOM|nr:kinase-like domain-containing protein [Rhizophagus clarus]